MLDRHRAAAQSDSRRLSQLIDQAKSVGPTRGFVQKLQTDSLQQLAVIAEIKRRSPSKGVLREGIDAVDLACAFEGGTASCLSVLTDDVSFGGSIDDLRQARAATAIPVLRKDFTVSELDVCDARIMGADCVLLIAAALSQPELASFYQLANEIGLDVLVETHDEDEVERALLVGATLIGVNQRDLVTFEVDHERAVRMAAAIPNGVVKVAESGVRDANDAQSLRNAGYDAVLVGESLIISNDPAALIGSLRVTSTKN
ncbi:MAG: indole-3-glycerol phosphate synthase [Acidimicrobiia bacterium BACL6 MAG-120924-bin43]|uniref:indole-3-glycerol-phosphate synthase n=1 Tax=Acidimicrobiia bacterium BACL6 MAG-120924-bin43 TaxID=1655583 RepID=A0A0R2QBY6_9ACTN|nr:MAG: indole-3-glycerol phosphate synthase [Acidimicrobiia bacterium BACL6 MAG-120924-bin43]